MYILFINSVGKCDIFFLLNLIIIVIKKIVQPMGSTRPNPTHVGWVGLDWTYVMGWVGLGWIFFDPPWWVGSKNLINLTHAHPHYLSYITTFIIFIFKTHDNYSPYKHIMIIYRKTHENITLFHYSVCYHILFETHGYCLSLKPMVNIILKKYWRSLFKSPKENIIYKNNPWKKLWETIQVVI